MAIVTMTGHLGSWASDIAALAARELDYAMADRELMLEGAAALGWTEQQLEEFDERTRGVGRRLTQLLGDFTARRGAGAADPVSESGGLEALMQRTYGDTAGPEMRTDDQLYIDALKALIQSFAQRGDTILVGRGSQAILSGREDTLHVRVFCSFDERVRRVAKRYEMSDEAAHRRVRNSDRAREAWHRKFFDIDYRSPYHYHLVLNSEHLSDTLAAGLVVQAVHGREPRPG